MWNTAEGTQCTSVSMCPEHPIISWAQGKRSPPALIHYAYIQYIKYAITKIWFSIFCSSQHLLIKVYDILHNSHITVMMAVTSVSPPQYYYSCCCVIRPVCLQERGLCTLPAVVSSQSGLQGPLTRAPSSYFSYWQREWLAQAGKCWNLPTLSERMFAGSLATWHWLA